MTRIELAEAAKRVKASLDTVSIEMTRLLDETRQRTSDHLGHLVEEATSSLGDFAKTVAGATTQLVSATSEAHNVAIAKTQDVTKRVADLAGEAEGAIRRLRAVEPPPMMLAERLEKVADSLVRMAADTEHAREQLLEAGQEAGKVTRSLTEATKGFAEATNVIGHIQAESVRRVDEAATSLQLRLDGLGQSLESRKNQLQVLEEQTTRTGRAAQDAVDAARIVLEQLTRMTRELTGFINSKA
jgi:chromosome segregation ATPase